MTQCILVWGTGSDTLARIGVDVECTGGIEQTQAWSSPLPSLLPPWPSPAWPKLRLNNRSLSPPHQRAHTPLFSFSPSLFSPSPLSDPLTTVNLKPGHTSMCPSLCLTSPFHSQTSIALHIVVLLSLSLSLSLSVFFSFCLSTALFPPSTSASLLSTSLSLCVGPDSTGGHPQVIQTGSRVVTPSALIQRQD